MGQLFISCRCCQEEGARLRQVNGAQCASCPFALEETVRAVGVGGPGFCNRKYWKLFSRMPLLGPLTVGDKMVAVSSSMHGCGT